jgi:hypothetical protein
MSKEESMSRLAILPALLIGLPLIGCAQAPSQNAGVPVADAQATPTGSHVKGAAPDPTTLTVSRANIDSARPFGVQEGMNESSLFPFATISGR